MSRFRLLVVGVAAVGLLVGQQVAATSDVSTSDPDTTQDMYGLTPDDVAIDPTVAPLLAEAAADSEDDPDPYCTNGYSYQPNATYTYKTYSVAFGDHHTAPLKIDLYLPPQTGTYPVLVLAYGGKWKHGCRKTLSNLAHAGAYGINDPQKFIALAIDYRLDCIPGAQPPEATNTDLCNWNYLSTDTTGNDGLNHGAAQHDVEDAMIWTRTQLQQKLPTGYQITMTPGANSHAGIALMGQSSGGHLAAMVGAPRARRNHRTA